MDTNKEELAVPRPTGAEAATEAYQFWQQEYQKLDKELYEIRKLLLPVRPDLYFTKAPVLDVIAAALSAALTPAKPAAPVAAVEGQVVAPIGYNLPYEDAEVMVYSVKLKGWHRGHRLGLNSFRVEGHGLDSSVTHYAELPAAPQPTSATQLPWCARCTATEAEVSRPGFACDLCAAEGMKGGADV